MSSNILSSNTLANPNTALYSGGGSGGVTQLVAGSGVTLSPAGGTGVVTVTSTTPAAGVFTSITNSGVSTLTGAVNAGSTLSVTGTSTLTGAVNSGPITVAGASSLTGGLTVDVLGCTQITGGSSTAAGFPYGLITTGGSITGFNSTRSNAVLNISTTTVDQTINWAGVPLFINGYVRGAGANFSINIILPADIQTNPTYRGMQILYALVQTAAPGSRAVSINIRDSASNLLTSSTLLNPAYWSLDARLGAVGDSSNPYGLWVVSNENTNITFA